MRWKHRVRAEARHAWKKALQPGEGRLARIAKEALERKSSLNEAGQRRPVSGLRNAKSVMRTPCMTVSCRVACRSRLARSSAHVCRFPCSTSTYGRRSPASRSQTWRYGTAQRKRAQIRFLRSGRRCGSMAMASQTPLAVRRNARLLLVFEHPVHARLQTMNLDHAE
jgi:hypothetical protein